MSDAIKEKLKTINDKLDMIIVAIEELRAAKREKSAAIKAKKKRLPPLTDD